MVPAGGTVGEAWLTGVTEVIAGVSGLPPVLVRPKSPGKGRRKLVSAPMAVNRDFMGFLEGFF